MTLKWKWWEFKYELELFKKGYPVKFIDVLLIVAKWSTLVALIYSATLVSL